jgi:hypothetical protein
VATGADAGRAMAGAAGLAGVIVEAKGGRTAAAAGGPGGARCAERVCTGHCGGWAGIAAVTA